MPGRAQTSSRPRGVCRALGTAAALAALAWGAPAEASLKGELRAALQTQRPALARCYDRELKRDDPATGTVLIKVVVDKKGRVTRSKLARASRKQLPVAKCLAARLKRLRLPAQPARVAVLVPIKLRVRGS